MRRLGAAVAAVGLTLTVVTACGGEDGGGNKPSSGDPVVNVAAGSSLPFVANFNPFSQSALSGTDSVIYEALVYFNGGKADDVQYQLATAYAFADGGKTITFTTRDGVKWSDGQAFSAEDVAFTFNLLKDNPKINFNGLPITEATATDPTHATVKFSQPVYTRLMLVGGRTWIVPKHLWSTVTDPAAYTNEKPVGTGPFVLKTMSTQNYYLERNPNYWEQGKPKIKGLRFLGFSGNDSVTAALAAGQVEWAGAFMPDIQKQYLDKDPKNHTYLNESQLYLTNLIPNLEKAPFNDPAVRKAVSLAIDRDRVLKLAFSGYGKPASPVQLPQPLYNDYIKPEYQSSKLEYNAQQAGQTLQQAGYAKGADGFYAKGGKRLSFTVKVVQGYSDYISALQIMTESLKAVGIEMKTQEEAYNAFYSDQEKGKFDMIITNLYADGPSPFSFYERAFASYRTKPTGQVAGSNYGRFRDSAVDAALTAIQATPPDQKDAIKTELFKIQDAIVAQLPYIPVQQSSSLIEMNTKKVKNWPTEQNHYAITTPFNGPDMGIVAKNLVPAS
jgi:peptide/nickel transport system substrate-binding protein